MAAVLSRQSSIWFLFSLFCPVICFIKCLNQTGGSVDYDDESADHRINAVGRLWKYNPDFTYIMFRLASTQI